MNSNNICNECNKVTPYTETYINDLFDNININNINTDNINNCCSICTKANNTKSTMQLYQKCMKLNNTLKFINNIIDDIIDNVIDIVNDNDILDDILDDDFTTFENDEKNEFNTLIVYEEVKCFTNNEIDTIISTIYSGVVERTSELSIETYYFGVNLVLWSQFKKDIKQIYNTCNNYIKELNSICNIIESNEKYNEIHKDISELLYSITFYITDINNIIKELNNITYDNTTKDDIINYVTNIRDYLDNITQLIHNIHIKVCIIKYMMPVPLLPVNDNSLSCSFGLISTFFNKIKELFI